MKLFFSTASPYARTAQVVLRECELDAEEIEYQTHPFENENIFLKSNPLGKVPCLLLDDGSSIYDSEVICQYLDQKFNHERLWQPVRDEWQLRKLYSQVSGLLDLAVALRQEKMREEEGLRSDFWWSRFESGLLRGLNDLNDQIEQFPKLMTLLHINTVCLLDYLAFRHPELSFNQSRLEPLCDGLKNRASFKATEPKG